MFKNLIFKKIEYVLGNNKETLNFLHNKNKSWDIKKIQEKTGIKNRYVANVNQNSLSLGIEVAKKLFTKINKNKIEVLLFVTQTPPVKLPQCSSFVQKKLKMNKNLYALDINLGCSGFIYALTIAKSLAETYDFKNFVIICSDTYNKFIQYNDRTCRTVFSDAASATYLTFENSKKKKIFEIDFGTDGGGYNDLIIKKINNKEILFMNGAKVFMFTNQAIPDSIKKVIKKRQLKIDQVDYYIFHQASKFVLDNLKDSLMIKKNKMYYGLNNLGNTVSSSIPIALAKLIKKKFLKKNKKVILCGFGVGLSWATLLINW